MHAARWLTLLATLALATSDSRAQTPDAADDALQAAKLEFFTSEIGKLRLTVAERPEIPCRLVDEPLITYQNPISQILDGLMFLWTDRGRPVAVVKSYNNLGNKSWGRTFVSIAPQLLRMQSHNRDLWMPTEAGVTFVKLPDAPKPADSPAARLTQMRNIARRFQVIDHWGIKDPQDWTLRLLSRPLYRYEVPDEHVLDGAMFGYVLTTGPEALTLIEARETSDGPAWFYAVSRCTRFEIRFALDDQPIAEFPRLEAWPPTGTYFHHPIPMVRFPYEKEPRTK